jgi:anthranilate phosphoribosyltransferase
MIGPVLERLLDPAPLGGPDARATLDALLEPAADEADRAALLVALTARGDAPAELVAFAREMRRRAVPFPTGRKAVVDLCGSGGAETPSFNVSTVSALVVRAAGVPVVKHGNRSRRVCGSSDLLAALGLPVMDSVPFARQSFERLGIAFLHAPLFHPATRAVASTRARLGVPTIFNRLGPLSNPARPRFQVSGVARPSVGPTTARALRDLGVRAGMTMVSDDGSDEFSPRSPTTAFVWSGARMRRLRIQPASFLPPEDRRGPWGPLPPKEAAEETERIVAGGGGARRGSVLLTSGAALWVAGRARSLTEGVAGARAALDGGGAERLLVRLRALAASTPRTQEK